MAFYAATAANRSGQLSNLPATGYNGVFEGGAQTGRVVGDVPGRGPTAAAYMNARDHTLEKSDPHQAPAIGTRFWGVNKTRGDELSVNLDAAITGSLDAVTKMVMPLQLHEDGTDFGWNISVPVRHVMETIPELAPAPRVQDRFIQMTTSLSRNAMAFNIDSSALTQTARGRQLYHMKLVQIRNSAIRKMLIIIYRALLESHNASTLRTLSVESDDVWASRARERASEDTFGALQRDAFGYEYTEAGAIRVMDSYGTKPDVVLVPKGTMSYINTTKARLTHSLMGPDKTSTAFARNNIAVNRTSKGGLVVIESVCVTDQATAPTDLLSRNVAIGEYVTIGLCHGRNEVGIEDQENSCDAFIKADEALWASGLFGEDGELKSHLVQMYINANSGDHAKCVADTPLVARATSSDHSTTRLVIPNSFGAMDQHHLGSNVIRDLKNGMSRTLKAGIHDLSTLLGDIDDFQRLASTAQLTIDVAIAATAQNLLSQSANFAGITSTELHGMPDLEAGIAGALGLAVAANGNANELNANGDELFDAFAGVAGNMTAIGALAGVSDGRVGAYGKAVAVALTRGVDPALAARLATIISGKIDAGAAAQTYFPSRYGSDDDRLAAAGSILTAATDGAYKNTSETVSVFPAGYHSYTGMQYLANVPSSSLVAKLYPAAVAAAKKAALAWSSVEAAISDAMPQSWINSGDVSSPSVMYLDASNSSDNKSSLLFNSLVAKGASPLFILSMGIASGGGVSLAPATGTIVDGTSAGTMPSMIKYMPGGAGAGSAARDIDAALIGVGAKNRDGSKPMTAGRGSVAPKPTPVAQAFDFAATARESGAWLKAALANAWSGAGDVRKAVIKGFIESWAAEVTAPAFRTNHPEVKDMLAGISAWSVMVAVCLEGEAAAGAANCPVSVAGMDPTRPVKVTGVAAGGSTISVSTGAGTHDVVLVIDPRDPAGTGAAANTYSYKATPLLMNTTLARSYVSSATAGLVAAAGAGAGAGANLTYAACAAAGLVMCGADPESAPLPVAHVTAMVTRRGGNIADASAHIQTHRGALLMGADSGSAARSMAFGGSHLMSRTVEDAVMDQRNALGAQIGEAFDQGHLSFSDLTHNRPWGIPLIARMSRHMLAQATSGTLLSRLSMAWIFGRFSVACISGMAAAGVPMPFDICLARPNRTYAMGSLVFAQRNAGVTLHAHTVFKVNDSVQDTQIEGQFITHCGAAVLDPQRVYVAHDRMYLGTLGGSGRGFYRHASLPLPDCEAAAHERLEADTDASIYSLLVPAGDANVRWDITSNSFANFLYKFGREESPQPPQDTALWSRDGTTCNTTLYPGYCVVVNHDGTTYTRQGTSPLGHTDVTSGRAIRSGTMGRQMKGASE